jgi:pimeloyl-ACP methyl ester carboxylesterase
MSYTSEFAELNGTRIHYLHWASDGPPILIVHGNTHCGGVYAPLAEKLQPDFEVFSMDLRGHGISDRADDYSWTALKGDVVGLIDALDLHDLLLVAHSRGGGACLLAAAARPDRVRGVLGYEPNVPLQLWHEESPDERMQALAAQARRRRDTFPDREGMYNHFKGRGAFKNWQDEYLRAYVEHGSRELADGTVTLASSTDVEAEMYMQIFTLTEWQQVHDCPVPVLSIYGEDSGRVISGQDPAAAARQLFTNVDVHIQANSTHSGPMEHPELFEAEIREFAKKTGS